MASNPWAKKYLNLRKRMLLEIMDECRESKTCEFCEFVNKDGFCGLSCDSSDPLAWDREVLEEG